jgi:hypothetical protein
MASSLFPSEERKTAGSYRQQMFAQTSVIGKKLL